MEQTFSKDSTQITNMHMKRCSISLIIKKMQSKTTVYRQHFTSTKMAMIKNRKEGKGGGREGGRGKGRGEREGMGRRKGEKDSALARARVWGNGIPHSPLAGRYPGAATRKTGRDAPPKSHVELPRDRASSLLSTADSHHS